MNRSGSRTSLSSSTHGRDRSADRVPSVDILAPHAHDSKGKIGGDETNEYLRMSLNPTAEGVEEQRTSEEEAARNRLLGISFLLMIFIGLMNKIFQKLQTIPMYNYPNFLNLLTTFMYIPLSFAYVIPAIRAGWIGEDQLAVPKKAFAVMGFLDCLAGIMQTFSATYLPGSLVVLLLQAAIPASMTLSAFILKARYHLTQYIAAVIVCVGIITVLAPSLFGGSDDEGGSKTLIWGVVLICSTIPMCLSSVYKEIALGETELDPVYLNAWIAVFQFFFSIPLAIPAALASDPPVYPSDLPRNLYDGLLCWVGENSKTCSDDTIDEDDYDGNCHVDECNPTAPIFVNVYLLFNVSYNILIIMILKWGSSNLLWLAMTIMVPLGNLAFALPFMPQAITIHATDIIGLVVIMAGLIGYKMGPGLAPKSCDSKDPDLLENDDLQESKRRLDEPLVGDN